MKQIRLDQVLVVLQHILAFGIVVVQALGLDGLTSLCFYAALLVTAALWLVMACAAFTRRDLLALAAVVLALVHVTIGVVMDPRAFSPEYLKKFLLFSGSILYFQSVSKITVSPGIRKALLCSVWLLAVFLMGMYLAQPVQMHLYGGQVSRYLTFRFSNPNLVALFLCCIFMVELSWVFRKGHFLLRLVHVLTAAVLYAFMLETQSRNALLVAAGYAVICLFLWVVRTNRTRFGRVTAALAAVFPLLFALFYMWLIRKSWVQAAFAFLIGEGKGLSSRIDIWSRALALFRESPVFGAYGSIMKHMEHFQMHNSHLDVLVSYGIGVFVLVCLLLYLWIRGEESERQTGMDYIHTLGFVCAVALGMGEAAVFSGGLSVYIFMGLFLLLRGRGEVPDAEAERTPHLRG